MKSIIILCLELLSGGKLPPPGHYWLELWGERGQSAESAVSKLKAISNLVSESMTGRKLAVLC